MTEEELIDILAANLRDAIEEDFRDSLPRVLNECESPIERILLAALLFQSPYFLCQFDEGIKFFSSKRGLQPFNSLLVGGRDNSVEYIGAIYCQTLLENKYRADIYIEAFDLDTERRWLRMAIECDGHDFHERTKQQVARDKARDRWFQVRGIILLRFSGSEICRDPFKCAEEVREAFLEAWFRYYRPNRASHD